MTEILPNTKNDIGNRGCTNDTLAKFKGLPRQTIVNVTDGYRLIVMDGSTLGGKFKAASVEEVQEAKSIASNALTKDQADNFYLAKDAKAQSAIRADSATSATKASQDANGNNFITFYASKTDLDRGLASKLNSSDAFTKNQADNRYLLKEGKANTAGTADKAISDGSGNVITSTYATKTAMNYALASKQDSSSAFTKTQADSLYIGKSEKVSSAQVADRANALSSRRYVSLSGAVTSSTTPFDGSGDLNINVTSINGSYITPFRGATNYSSGTAGGVPAPLSGSHNKFLRGDGTWQSPEHTDTRVMQSFSSSNYEYPLLAKDSTGTGNTTSSTVFASNIKINPYSNTVTANTFKGSLEGTASYATRAGTVSSVNWSAISDKPGIMQSSGDMGSITVYESLTPASTVTNSSSRSMTLGLGESLSVNDGTYNKAWITVVALEGGATINLGPNWRWANGKVPSLAKGIVSLAWYGTFGIASFSKYGQ